jgi:transitional endoplasmic reticulum ATPase
MITFVLSHTRAQPTALSDTTVSIHPNKAKELNVKTGDAVVVIGRRRRATFARVSTGGSKKKASSCVVSGNLASNLRLRNGDKLKVIPLVSSSSLEEEKRSGDMLLLEHSQPPKISSITLSPVEDSLALLEASEGGDELSDEEIMSRFITPYLNTESGDKSLLKKGLLLKLHDDNRKTLEFVVSHVELEGQQSEEGEEMEEEDNIPVAGEVDASTGVVLGSSTAREVVGLGYDSVGGLDKAIQLMRELVELPLRFPELWTTAGVPTPKGVLLHGPPGCGKTLIANALVEETGAHVVVVNGPEIMARKGGESEANLRQAFEEAMEKAPSIIFMDELDSIAPKRDQAQGETEKRVVSQLLTLMDSLKPSSNVIVIGATNRPNVIESALRRPGRFDRELEIVIPDEDGRHEILKIKTKDMQLDSNVDLFQIARDTHGFVGADIQQLTLEAALQCIRSNIANMDVDSEEPIPEEKLDMLQVNSDHFMHALGVCDPSALRENKVEVSSSRFCYWAGSELPA